MAGPKQPARTGARRRWPAIAALLAVVGVLALWLSNCIPGFGLGSSGDSGGTTDGDGEQADAAKPEKSETTKTQTKTEPPKPEPTKPEPTAEPPPLGSAGTTLTVKIGVAGCAVADSEPIDCSKMCERTELFTGIDDAVLEVAGASHGSVVAMLDCLKAKGIDKVAVRRE